MTNNDETQRSLHSEPGDRELPRGESISPERKNHSWVWPVATVASAAIIGAATFGTAYVSNQTSPRENSDLITAVDGTRQLSALNHENIKSLEGRMHYDRKEMAEIAGDAASNAVNDVIEPIVSTLNDHGNALASMREDRVEYNVALQRLSDQIEENREAIADGGSVQYNFDFSNVAEGLNSLGKGLQHIHGDSDKKGDKKVAATTTGIAPPTSLPPEVEPESLIFEGRYGPLIQQVFTTIGRDDTPTDLAISPNYTQGNYNLIIRYSDGNAFIAGMKMDPSRDQVLLENIDDFGVKVKLEMLLDMDRRFGRGESRFTTPQQMCYELLDEVERQIEGQRSTNVNSPLERLQTIVRTENPQDDSAFIDDFEADEIFWTVGNIYTMDVLEELKHRYHMEGGESLDRMGENKYTLGSVFSDVFGWVVPGLAEANLAATGYNKRAAENFTQLQRRAWYGNGTTTEGKEETPIQYTDGLNFHRVKGSEPVSALVRTSRNFEIIYDALTREEAPLDLRNPIQRVKTGGEE